MSSDRGEWNQLYDKFYRKLSMYDDLLWDEFNFDHYRIAVAPFAGPIALVRDERALMIVGSRGRAVDDLDEGGQPHLRIFTAAGTLLSSIVWSHIGLVGFAWNAADRLVCVCDDGSVYVYSVTGEQISQFVLPSQCRSDGVAEAIISDDGLVVRTAGRSELFAVLSMTDPRPIRLPDAQLRAPPTAMAILSSGLSDPSDPSSSPTCEVLLATHTGSLLVVDQTQCIDQQLTTGPYVKLAVSGSGKYIAAFNEEGTLYVMTSDFSSNISKFGTNSKIPPRDMVWCSEESVVLYWDGMILLVGMYGDFVKYSYDCPLVLRPEIDGVRIISHRRHEWLEKVSESSEAIFKIGSDSSGAVLYDAELAYEDKSGKAAELLRSIESIDESDRNSPRGLRAAIDTCLNAATHEFAVSGQRSLLKAAAYGKLFSATYKADRFVDVCRTLRVLNAVRATNVGIPLTFTEYQHIEAESLIDRLIHRHLHLLAVRICQYLKMDIDRVLVHWACAKIAASTEEENEDGELHTSSTGGGEGGNEAKSRLTDEKLGELIISKVKMCNGISFAPIATTAFRNGRRALATMLLEYEPLAADQVPLLLSMKEDELALDKAIQSGDTDLVYMCMLHMKKTRPLKEFVHLIRERPLARSLYIAYCKATDLPALKTFYYAIQSPVEAANVAVLEAYQCEDLRDRVNGLTIAMEFYEKDKGSSFIAKATDDQIKLLNVEREYDQNRLTTAASSGSSAAARYDRTLASNEKAIDPNASAVDLSVTAMLQLFIQLNDRKRATKLQTQFKMSDSRMWHTDVRTLANNQQWDDMYKLVVAYKKTPPIGYLPFIEACVEAKKYNEAVRYIERLSDHRSQIEWLCNINYWKEAADVAAKSKDKEALQVIRESCRNPTVIAHIDKLLSAPL